MAERTGHWIDPQIVHYAQGHAHGSDDAALAWMTERTQALGRESSMQIGPDQVALMTILTKLVGVSFAVEVGTFTGTSSLAIARGLRPGGRLLCCDVSTEWTDIAQQGWQLGGVADRIDLRIAPALETLAALPKYEAIDLAFVDADKTNYQRYLDEIIPRLRPGGVLLVDNTIWHGRVVQPTADDDHDTAAIKAVNESLARDPRMESVLLTIGDGLTVARRKS